MRGAPLRIERHPNQMHLGSRSTDAGIKYADALTKLIPGEVVAAYLAGKSVLQTSPDTGHGLWLGWTIFCVVAVFLWRGWLTSDNAAGVPAEWPAVILTCASFLVWVYSFGDVFVRYELWDQKVSALILIGWTLLAPKVLSKLSGP